VSGKLVAISAIVRDITERKKAKKRESSRKNTGSKGRMAPIFMLTLLDPTFQTKKVTPTGL